LRNYFNTIDDEAVFKRIKRNASYFGSNNSCIDRYAKDIGIIDISPIRKSNFF
jgi:hypothetical protein